MPPKPPDNRVVAGIMGVVAIAGGMAAVLRPMQDTLGGIRDDLTRLESRVDTHRLLPGHDAADSELHRLRARTERMQEALAEAQKQIALLEGCHRPARDPKP